MPFSFLCHSGKTVLATLFGLRADLAEAELFASVFFGLVMIVLLLKIVGQKDKSDL